MSVTDDLKEVVAFIFMATVGYEWQLSSLINSIQNPSDWTEEVQYLKPKKKTIQSGIT